MPQVGNKHFPYTTKGIAQAKVAAKKTKQVLSIKPSDAYKK